MDCTEGKVMNRSPLWSKIPVDSSKGVKKNKTSLSLELCFCHLDTRRS